MAVYSLADRLHMTAAHLMATMTVDEFVHWLAFHKIRLEHIEER